MKTRKWTTNDLGAPLRWRKPYPVEVPDLFDGSWSNEEIAAVFGVMAAAPQHTFLLLTERPERALEFFKWTENQGVTSERRMGDPYASEILMQYTEVFGVAFPSSVVARPWWPLPNVRVYFMVGGERVTVAESVNKPHYP